LASRNILKCIRKLKKCTTFYEASAYLKYLWL
jgi:hypothetical protein